jgi:hypothetical protein
MTQSFSIQLTVMILKDFAIGDNLVIIFCLFNATVSSCIVLYSITQYGDSVKNELMRT